MSVENFELLGLNMQGRKANVPLRSASDGDKDVAWFLRDGAFVGANYKQALVFSGVCYQVSVGTFSTPVTGGGNGLVLDADQPELVIDVPASRAIMLLRVRVDCQVPLLAADSEECEILLAIDRAAVSGASATNGTVETPMNMRTDLGSGGSGCTIVSAVTTNLTAAPTLGLELAHPVIVGDVQGTAANARWQNLFLDYDPQASSLVVGPATVVVYWGGTVAVTGFASVEYAEFTKNEAI